MRHISTFFMVLLFFLSFAEPDAMAGKLQDNGNGTVTDNETGMIWQKSDGGKMDWKSAISYCKKLSLGGDTDYRLPHIDELKTLVHKKSRPSIDINFFPDTKIFYYWSSSPHRKKPKYAWRVNFANGKFGYCPKREARYARCVRGGR